MTEKVTIRSEDTLYDAAELFKIFGDSTRIRILYSLFEKEKNVNEIAEELSMSLSAISHQLRILKGSDLVKNRRSGKNIYYSLADEHVYNILYQGIEHVEE
jgi:ArsR family transcriptional regulator